MDDFGKELAVRVLAGFIILVLAIGLFALVIYLISIKIEVALNTNDILNVLNGGFRL